MTVIGPSLVNIANSLGATLADVGWVMAIYATGSLIAQPLAGRLSDARGRRAVFIGTVVVFAAGSLVCALSTTLGWLIAGRVIQSLGAGGIQPAAIALIGQRVPKDRQSSALYAIFGMFALAGALGAVVGGTLIDGGRLLGESGFLGAALRRELALYPWHLIFWINLPLAALTIAMAVRLDRDESAQDRIGADVGAIVLIPALAFCLMMAANGSSSAALGWIAAAALCIAALVYWERSARNAFFDPALFSQKGAGTLYAIALLSGIPIFSVTMYSAAYFMTQFNASAAQSGMALLALALPLGAGQWAGGRLARRLGLRALLVSGLIALAVGEIVLAAGQSVASVLVAFAIVGFGIGLSSAPPNALVLRYVTDQHSGAATGLLTMLGSSGAISAPAAVSAFLHYSHLPAGQSIRLDFLLSFVLAALCVPLAALLPREP